MSSSLIQTHRNLGKAYYEQGKYPECVAEFQKVIASGQAQATDHMDLGMALMQSDKLDEALGEMTTARKMDAKLVAADYNLGILYKRESRFPDAEAALKRVAEADPRDPAAWFNLGVTYYSENKLDEALSAYQRVLDMGFGRGQNFYVATLFRVSTALFRLKRAADAQKYLALHDKVKDKVPGVSVQTTALEAGKYGAIIVPPASPLLAAGTPKPEKISFAEITSNLGIALPTSGSEPAGPAFANLPAMARQTVIPIFSPSMAVGDYDGDGRPDLYITLPTGSNHLFHNQGDGTFTDVTTKAGVAGPGASLSATFADYDNSGHPSLFVAGLGGVTLYHNNGNGSFTDVTVKAGLKGPPGELATRAVLFDADDDGFLDLVVTAWTNLSDLPQNASTDFTQNLHGVPSHFYRNNADGTFSDITTSSGLGSAKGRMSGAVFADFNNDGYTDLLFFRDDGPPLLYINEGEDKFVDRTAEAGPELSNAVAWDGQVADFNHDGNFDLVLWGRDTYSVLLNRGNARFESARNLPPIKLHPSPFDYRGTVADLDGDGFAGLIALDDDGRWHYLANRGGRFDDTPLVLPASSALSEADKASTVQAGTPAQVMPAWPTNPGKLDLLTITRFGLFAAYEKEGPPARWLQVNLTGMKSNLQGIGAVVEAKAGNFYEKVTATGGPVRIFTGNLTKLDVVRVTWPNQIVENSIDVATNKPLEVRESERLASSCPFLYVWNGKQFVYFTDILGMAPIGELAPDGSWSVPNPREFVRLPDGLPSQNGIYTFQITDEMREVDSVDQLRLVAVDHPAPEEILSNEIFSTTPVPPAIFAVREKHTPVSAVDDAGRDVLPKILKADGKYVAGFRPNRILGLADTHSLTLDLGEFSSQAPVALWLRGWVFWTDSNASRALMTNSQLQMVMPYLQVRDAGGQWKTVVPDMGLPSATNRTMRVDLTGKFLTGDHHVRIVTNLCVYWDQIFWSPNDEAVAAVSDRRNSSGQRPAAESTSAAPQQAAVPQARDRRYTLPLVSADMHFRGFSTPVSDPRHVRPDYFEYTKLATDAPWNPMTGIYTRYGAVDQLLREPDDRLVVMSPGDEITVRFDASRLPPLLPGWKRSLFLYTVGYAKDGEPNSAFSRVVGPLPFLEMSKYPYAPPEHFPNDAGHRQYDRDFETRRGRALIPPLAPAGH